MLLTKPRLSGRRSLSLGGVEFALPRWVCACSADGDASCLERTVSERLRLPCVELPGTKLLERVRAHSGCEESCHEGVARANGVDDVDRGADSCSTLAPTRRSAPALPRVMAVTVAPRPVKWVFLAPDAREVLPDWTDVAQGLLARLRARAGRHPGAAAYTELENDLRGTSPEVDPWWSRYDVGTEGGGIKRVRLADGRVQRLAYTSFDIADRPDQTMTTYRRR